MENTKEETKERSTAEMLERILAESDGQRRKIRRLAEPAMAETAFAIAGMVKGQAGEPDTVTVDLSQAGRLAGMAGMPMPEYHVRTGREGTYVSATPTALTAGRSPDGRTWVVIEARSATGNHTLQPSTCDTDAVRDGELFRLLRIIRRGLEEGLVKAAADETGILRLGSV